MGGPVWAQAVDLNSEVQFNVPAQALDAALLEVSRQASVQLVVAAGTVPKTTAPAVVGRMALREALNRLLHDTGLAFQWAGEHTVTITAAKRTSGETISSTQRAAQGDAPTSGPGGSNAEGAPAAPAGPASRVSTSNSISAGSPATSLPGANLEAIIVTGTNIRGVTSTTSPVQVFTRDDIDRMGFGSVQELIQRLPQNFNGGASDSTLGSIAGGGNAANQVGGSGVNLRGLGNDATLVLVNGRRVAPGNTSGNFVDISLIPLSAIERVEVVTDGASAIYGSDAVGGVVNFILRHDLEGGETRLRYGSDYKGATHETDVGQSLGHNWGSGHALLSYEFVDRTPLTGADRPYTQELSEPTTLLPQQIRHGAFLTLEQTVGSGVDAFFDGNYSHRATNSYGTTPFFSSENPADISAYGGTLGTRIDLPAGAKGEFSGTYAASHTQAQTVTSGTLTDNQDVHSTVWSLDAKVDGALGSLPAGPVRYAIGAQYRKESFDDADPFVFGAFAPSRSVIAEFVELRLPLIGASSTETPWGDRLTVSLADRNEHYGDFGSTNNPQLGLIWRPASSVLMRANVGTSFHAPLLSDLNPIPSQVIPYPEPDPTTGGMTNALLLFGGNPDLKPEKATTWSLGAEFQPIFAPGLKMNLAYYNIRFKDRIANAQGQGVDLANALAIENILGPQIIQRNPPQSLVQALVATPGYADLFGTGIDPSTVGVLVDSRSHNLSTQSTSGVDFGVSYTTPTPLGTLDTGVAGTRILKFDNQFTTGSPAVSILNTVYNPVDWKLRAQALLTHNAFTAAIFLNYVNSYHDDRSGTSIPVASWTTADATVGYTWGPGAGLLSSTALTLAVLNVANARPPFAAAQFPGSYGGAKFDGANANALGRYMSVQLTKRY
jgi:outer membrane receptor protein involved in Fe transport